MFIFINCTWCDLSDGVIARNSFPKTFYKIPFSNQHWPNAGQTRHFILALPGCNVYFEKKNVCITFHWNKFRHLCKTNTYIDSYLEYIMYKWGANFVFFYFFSWHRPFLFYDIYLNKSLSFVIWIRILSVITGLQIK